MGWRMKICFVTDGTLNCVWQNKLDCVSDSDLLVFGFNGLGLVSYKKELSGETEYFQDVAKMSRQLSCVIICGCDTDTYGIYRHSAVIADKGKILGVSDTVNCIDETEYVAGGSYRVYDTSVGKIGIIVCEDLFFFESSEILAACDADVVICPFKKIVDSMPLVMARACAFSGGLAMGVCAEKFAAVSDICGNVTACSRSDIVKCSIKIERDYHFVGTKRRGFCRKFRADR